MTSPRQACGPRPAAPARPPSSQRRERPGNPESIRPDRPDSAAPMRPRARATRAPSPLVEAPAPTEWDKEAGRRRPSPAFSLRRDRRWPNPLDLLDEHALGHRPDVLVRDDTVRTDEERLGHAVHPEIDGGARAPVVHRRVALSAHALDPLDPGCRTVVVEDADEAHAATGIGI